MRSPKSDLLQGTLDLLILQIAAHVPLHGYAIGHRIQQISKDTLQVQQGSLDREIVRLR
jgi:PadR family transcriptional regulator